METHDAHAEGQGAEDSSCREGPVSGRGCQGVGGGEARSAQQEGVSLELVPVVEGGRGRGGGGAGERTQRGRERYPVGSLLSSQSARMECHIIQTVIILAGIISNYSNISLNKTAS